MCYNCGTCDREHGYSGDDAIDAAEQNILFGRATKEAIRGKSY